MKLSKITSSRGLNLTSGDTSVSDEDVIRIFWPLDLESFENVVKIICNYIKK